MADGAKTSKVANVGGFLSKLIPKPSIDIVKFWQGIVEIAVRVALLLFLLITFGVCSAAQGQAQRINDPRFQNAKAGAGWAIFVGVIAFIYEILFLITRFLIFPILQEFRTIYYIVEIVFKAVIALCLFTAFISLAVYAQESHRLATVSPNFAALLREIGNALGGAAFFSFICLAVCVFLAVWMILYLVFRWDIKSPSAGSDVKS